MKHPSQIKISDYNYELPDEKIAKHPLAQRDQSKLLVYKQQKVSEDTFKHLNQHLPEEAVLVFNNTKVISARLQFMNDNGREIEIFCLEPDDVTGSASEGLLMQGHTVWKCLVGNLRRWKQPQLSLTKNACTLTAKILQKQQAFVLVEFEWQPEHLSFAEILKTFGNLPIPPYLNRATEDTDTVNYQTTYSVNEGSVAAPTAGLHFTPEVLETLKAQEHQALQITLHVGAGTFQPVKSEIVGGHQMHAEWIDVNIDVIQQLAKHCGKNIIAVGTTSLRTIESLYWMGCKILKNQDAQLEALQVRQWDPYENASNIACDQSLEALVKWMQKQNMNRLICKTAILIAPPYELKVASGILTNFHQPQSTLLLLVSAIVGEKWRDLYTYALQNGFRFLSYGDSSLLLK